MKTFHPECALCYEEAMREYSKNTQIIPKEMWSAFLRGWYKSSNTTIAPTCEYHEKERVLNFMSDSFSFPDTDFLSSESHIITIIGDIVMSRKEIKRAETVFTLLGFLVFSPMVSLFIDMALAGRFCASSDKMHQLTLKKIEKSDAIVVVNTLDEEGKEEFLGMNRYAQVAFARSLGKNIFWLHPHTCRENCNCRYK